MFDSDSDIYSMILTTGVSYVCVTGKVVSFVLSAGNPNLVKLKLRETRYKGRELKLFELIKDYSWMRQDAKESWLACGN